MPSVILQVGLGGGGVYADLSPTSGIYVDMLFPIDPQLKV